jgi:glutamate dehydrogenase/leucine dehydrogenase
VTDGTRTGRRRPVTEIMAEAGHEQLVFVRDADAGLDAVIAVHSTALGPALGGVRFWGYPTTTDAAVDALRLAEAMTQKAALAGLDQGGGKAVVRWSRPDAPHPPELLRALARAVDALGGRYLAAEDVGATTADMDALARDTPWVTGVSEADGGSGDPSPVTAFGVVSAMRAALVALDGDPALAGRRVVVQGAGHVGAHLARLLVEGGATVAIADLFSERAAAVARDVGGTVLAAPAVLTASCDVLAPCALGGVITEDVVSALQCRAIVGAANNQLAGVGVDRAIAARGIVHVPDVVASAGGIINIAGELTGYDRAYALARAARIEETAARVLATASERGVTPTRAAVALARERIASEGSGRRWEPGDPAKWTNGRPLERLRP